MKMNFCWHAGGAYEFQDSTQGHGKNPCQSSSYFTRQVSHQIVIEQNFYGDKLFYQKHYKINRTTT